MQFRDAGSNEDEFCKGYEDYLQCPLQVSAHEVFTCCIVCSMSVDGGV